VAGPATITGGEIMTEEDNAKAEPADNSRLMRKCYSQHPPGSLYGQTPPGGANDVMSGDTDYHEPDCECMFCRDWEYWRYQ
jgi:hypothetical protein